MRIERRRIDSLKPAPYNPRKDIYPGDAEYEKLKRSLEEFGYVEPVILNERTGYIVGGHQRLKVLRELGVAEIECVIVDLSEEREKALNIALNKINNDWDEEKLSELLEDLQDTDIDLTLTGFDSEELKSFFEVPDFKDDEDDDSYYGDEREKTFNAYRLHEFDNTRTAGYYQFPTLKACHYVPDELIGFNYVKSWKGKREGLGVHFFVDDYQFERMWTRPFENIERLRGFSCVFTPGFSIYYDMPLAMKIWNLYRQHLIGQVMQDAGLNVIPTLSWSGAETFPFCFDGIEPGGVYALGTVGVLKDKDALERCYAGISEALKRLEPECILCYGHEIDYDFGKVPVKKYLPRTFKGLEGMVL